MEYFVELQGVPGGQNDQSAQIARTVVYVVQAGSFCKVGISSNMQSRMGQYRVHCPLHVVLRFSTEAPDPGALEKAAHANLAEHRHHGEWFKVSPLVARRAIFEEKRRLWPPPVRSPEETAALYDQIVGHPRQRTRRKKRTAAHLRKAS